MLVSSEHIPLGQCGLVAPLLPFEPQEGPGIEIVGDQVEVRRMMRVDVIKMNREYPL